MLSCTVVGPNSAKSFDQVSAISGVFIVLRRDL
jgi:hypothetical protein